MGGDGQGWTGANGGNGGTRGNGGDPGNGGVGGPVGSINIIYKVDASNGTNAYSARGGPVGSRERPGTEAPEASAEKVAACNRTLVAGMVTTAPQVQMARQVPTLEARVITARTGRSRLRSVQTPSVDRSRGKLLPPE
jgi:hypothetical protein